MSAAKLVLLENTFDINTSSGYHPVTAWPDNLQNL